MDAKKRILLTAGTALALATGARGADWYVSADMAYGVGVADAAHRTNVIQAAIAKAAQNDTIWVEDGFVCDSGSSDVNGSAYRIASGKTLTLRSQGGDWRTGPTIRGSRDEAAPVGGFAKTAVNSKVQIIGFNFEDCAITSGDGGGVRGNGSGASGYNLTLRSCRLSNCKASNGGGATLVEAHDCVFDGNLAEARGGGLYSANAYGCSLSNCEASTGGGFSSGTASNCVFTGNSGGNGGGAESVDALRCTFLDNTSRVYGGGCKNGSARDSFFARNRAGTRGGGIHINDGSSISNCVFACNTAVGYGGGIALQNTSSVVIRDCVITNNTTGETGGGISSGLYGPVLYNSLVANNVATNNGGGTFNVTLVDCVVTNNTSASGYGGGACGGRFARNCTFLGNSAGSRGGGICAVTASDCSILGNTAKIAGGGICGHSGQVGDATVESLFVTNCVIAGNTLTGDGTSSSVYGGAGAYGATLVGCVVSNNWSECWTGGGTYCCNTINTLIVGNTCAFEYNNNNRGGGGVNGGTHYNALIAGNTSWGGGGGALYARLVNCTVVANTNASTKATLAGGVGACNLINTVSWGNVGADADGLKNHVATNSVCSVSLASYGPDNTTADPNLRADKCGLYVPAGKSSCRNAAKVFDWMTDPADVRSRALGGRARIVGAAPDIGAYEAGLDGTRFFAR